MNLDSPPPPFVRLTPSTPSEVFPVERISRALTATTSAMIRVLMRLNPSASLLVELCVGEQNPSERFCGYTGSRWHWHPHASLAHLPCPPVAHSKLLRRPAPRVTGTSGWPACLDDAPKSREGVFTERKDSGSNPRCLPCAFIIVSIFNTEKDVYFNTEKDVYFAGFVNHLLVTGIRLSRISRLDTFHLLS
jgi:hypothetical protein